MTLSVLIIKIYKFQCGDWLQLKILEMTPEVASLGANLAEALELQKAHNEVLKQLQVDIFISHNVCFYRMYCIIVC